MWRKLFQGSLVGLAAAALALLVWQLGWLETWEANAWDLRARYLARPGSATPSIKLLLLDQASLDWGKKVMGWPWPWPRQAYSAILEFCRDGGAKAIVFDVVYTEPSREGVWDDQAFAEAIAKTPQFACAFTLGREEGEYTQWPSGVPASGLKIEGLDSWLTGAREKSVTFPRAAFPIPDVATNATVLGNAFGEQDEGGVLRRANLFRLFDRQLVPSLGLASFLVGEKFRNAPVSMRLAGNKLYVGDYGVPIDDQGRAVLRFRKPPQSFDRLRAAAVINSYARLQEGGQPEIRPEVFKDCYVLFGFSAPALLDLRPTPIHRTAPGVEVHATLLDNLLSRDFISSAPRGIVMGVTALLAVLSGLAVRYSWNARQSVIAFLIFLPVPALLGAGLYTRNIWWPVMVGEMATALSLIGAVVLNYATEGKQKRFIKSAFNQYVGEEVLDELVRDPSKLKLGGEKRELTMFFSDLEKFSSFSERLEPPRLIELLNVYLTEMGQIIKQETGGYLDKFVGDAIVAFWNAPVLQPDHAARAVRAAILCQRRLAAKRDEWVAQFGAVLKMRIGIGTGEVVVGNMGSLDKFNYTMLGDAANASSRLEGANKAFGTYTMVSDVTWAQARSVVVGRELGEIRVVGRKTPVKVFEPMSLAGESLPSWVADFERGLSLCRERRWPDAAAVFEKITGDPAAQVYAGKCREAAAADWDGVWNLTEK